LEGNNTLAPAALPMYDPVEHRNELCICWNAILKRKKLHITEKNNNRRLNESVKTIKDTDDIK